MDTLHCTSIQASSQALDSAWPDFPLPLTEAVGVRLDKLLYAGLGSSGQAWFVLDMAATAKVWQPCANFPFAMRKGSVAAAANGKIYVFGGSGRSTEEQSLHQFDSIARYDPQGDCWTELSVPLPVGMLGASAAAIGSFIYIFGGYNKPQFDQFFHAFEAAAQEQQSAMLCAFMDRTIEDFAWNAHAWEFDTKHYSWRDLGEVPHAPNCGSGIIVDGAEIMLANGELKPGLRSTSVKHASVQGGELFWQAEKELPALAQPQEGLAAAFSGKCGKVKIIAGGTHFPGARQRYQSGEKYAHQGLSKRWCDEIYLLRNDSWEFAGRLPQGRASGLAFEVEEGLLLVGGDTQHGQPCLETWLLSYEESIGITISRSKLK